MIRAFNNNIIEHSSTIPYNFQMHLGLDMAVMHCNTSSRQANSTECTGVKQSL